MSDLAELFALVARLPGHYVTIEHEMSDGGERMPTACLWKREGDWIEENRPIVAVNAMDNETAARLLLDMLRKRVPA